MDSFEVINTLPVEVVLPTLAPRPSSVSTVVSSVTPSPSTNLIPPRYATSSRPPLTQDVLLQIG